MATRSYVGAAPLVAKVVTVTPGGTIAATDTFTVAIGNSSFTFTATTTTVAHVVTGLYNLIVAAQTASAAPEWANITATDSTTTLTLTAQTAGEDFTVTSSIVNTSGGAVPTLVTATTTANSGPDQYDLAANWSSSTLPVNGDTVIIEGPFNLRYGDLSAVTAARLIVRQFSGEIGLAPFSSAGYYQYRQQYFLMSATLLDVLQDVTSSLMRFNVGTAQCFASVQSTGTPQPLIKSVTFLGTHADNTMHITGGSVGIATEAGEVATIKILKTGEAAGEIELGLGVTLSQAVEFDGGTIDAYCDVPGGQIRNCTLTVWDDADLPTSATTVGEGATLIINAGDANGLGGAGTYVVYAIIINDGGTVDLTQDTRQVRLSQYVTLNDGGSLQDPIARIYWEGTLTVPNFDKVDLRLGANSSWDISP